MYSDFFNTTDTDMMPGSPGYLPYYIAVAGILGLIFLTGFGFICVRPVLNCSKRVGAALEERRHHAKLTNVVGDAATDADSEVDSNYLHGNADFYTDTDNDVALFIGEADSEAGASGATGQPRNYGTYTTPGAAL